MMNRCIKKRKSIRATGLLLLLLLVFCSSAFGQVQETADATQAGDAFSSENSTIGATEDTPYNDVDVNTTILDADPSESGPEKFAGSEINVEDYLDSLSDQELEAICIERGFDITAPPQSSSADIHSYYVEAAHRCLNIEDEINSVLAKNPELAAELETEIERMRLEKERLLQEREEILAQKEALEQQLKAAGVDISSNGTLTLQGNELTGRTLTAVENHVDLTLEEVLKESLTLLFQRVHQDFKLVASILRPVLKPVGDGLRLVWRYSRPTVEAFAKKAVIGCAKLKNSDVFCSAVSTVLSPMQSIWSNKGKSAIEHVYSKVVPVVEQLKRNEHIQTAVTKLEPILKPLGNAIAVQIKQLNTKFITIKSNAIIWVKDTLEAGPPSNASNEEGYSLSNAANEESYSPSDAANEESDE